MTHSKGPTDWFLFAPKYDDWIKRTASREEKKNKVETFFLFFYSTNRYQNLYCERVFVSLFMTFFLSVFHLRTHILCILWHWRLYRTGTLIFVYTLKRYKWQCVMNALSKFELKFHNFFSLSSLIYLVLFCRSFNDLVRDYVIFFSLISYQEMFFIFGSKVSRMFVDQCMLSMIWTNLINFFLNLHAFLFNFCIFSSFLQLN